MRDSFNDLPIETQKEDYYGIAPFSENLAKSILGIKNPIGTTIAINGEWGSGKSSSINLVQSALKDKNDPNLTVTSFKCWWYRGEEALALAFLQELSAIIGKSIGKKALKILRQIVLKAGPVIGSMITGASSEEISKGIKYILPDKDETLDHIFLELSKLLEKNNKKFLIIIDDIDRLLPEETLAVFKLIKTIGRLPNVIYLLAYDRSLVEKIVHDKYPSEDGQFLEKIIQASFDLPAPDQFDLNNALDSSIGEICGPLKPELQTRFRNVFLDVIEQYIKLPRDIVRFCNIISVTWPPIKGEVDIVDFLALEIIRLYEPDLFRHICSYKKFLFTDNYRKISKDDLFKKLISNKDAIEPERIKKIIIRIFPTLDALDLGDSAIRTWDRERRVCVSSHFETYSRWIIGNSTLSREEIDDLISKAGDTNFIKQVLRNYSGKQRKSGQSMVPICLASLISHSSHIEKSQIDPLLSALFEIFDEINLDIDNPKGFSNILGTESLYYQLVRILTINNFSLDDRTRLLLKAIKSSSLGWIARFYYISSDSEQHIVKEDALPEIKRQTLNSIRKAAKDNTLLNHKDLLRILHLWHNLMDDNTSEVRAWTDTLLDNSGALLTLTRAFTATRYTMGLGEWGTLPDRVQEGKRYVGIPGESIIDTIKFRNKLVEKIKTDELDENEKTEICEFLRLWNQQEEEYKKR